MIYKRGKVYWIKYYRNGKPYYESSRSKKETGAKRLLKRREGEISQGKVPGVYFDKVRFDELAEAFLRDRRINGKDVSDAEKRLKHLRPVFEGVRVPNITTPKTNAYIEKRLSEGAANATINRELSALKRMLNLGAQQTPPKVDRVPYIPMLKENNVRKGFFEHGEFLSLRDALPDYLKGFVTFGYHTGWRVSEITGLTWDRVDLENGVVRLEVGETKNNEARTVYLDEELIEVLRCQWEARKSSGILTPYVFPSPAGNGQIKQFRSSWVKACQKAGIGKRLFHDFRRTAVRNMVRSGIPESVAMKISGHKTRSVFERYNIINDTDLRLAAQKHEAYLNAQKVTKTVTISNFPTQQGAVADV
jgi:integrase